MGRVRESIEIEAPRDAVFDLAADARRWPEWQSTTVEVSGVQTPLDAVGKTYSIVANLAGRRVEGAGRVTKYERPSVFEITGSAPGGGQLVTTTTFEPTDGGTWLTVDLEYELPRGVLAILAAPFVERQIADELRRSVENFRALAERHGSG